MENFWYNAVSKKKRNFGESLFLGLLIFVSFFYRLGLLIKKILYAVKILKPVSFNAKVICAGNITLGGTGKTPFIEEVAKRLTREEKSVLIVCKGYRRRKVRNIDVVSDGGQILLKQRDAGDEAFLLARNVPKARVIVADNKIKGIRFGVEKFRPDFVLVDDGFQKREALGNAAQVVLVDAINPAGFNRLFPAGMLREPLPELKHADAVVITNVNLAGPEKTEKVKELVQGYDKKMNIFESEHQPKFFYNVSTGERYDLNYVNEKKAIVFSSIGNPVGFERTLKSLGAHIILGLRFPDHHRLRKKEMEAIMKLYDATKASMVITTEKDEVKLSRKYIVDNRIIALKIGMFIKNVRDLEKKLRIS